ncbi:MAG: methyltransferase domain-containing protein [Caldimonas sp.]
MTEDGCATQDDADLAAAQPGNNIGEFGDDIVAAERVSRSPVTDSGRVDVARPHRSRPDARATVAVAWFALVLGTPGSVDAAGADAATLSAASSAAPSASAPTTSSSQSEAAYQRGRPSADGIGKRYMGREIAGIMGWQGAAWLEREEREREERTDLLLSELALKPGMSVADIGAGTGYVSRRMAQAVGPQGRVYAVDVQPEMIRLLTAGAKKAGMTQITPVLGGEDDVRLQASSIDLAIMVDVYHELEFPREVLASVVRALKPAGRVVFVEYRAEDDAVPIKPLHKMTEAQVKLEASRLPLVWEHTGRSLPWQHVVVFRKAPEGAPAVR